MHKDSIANTFIVATSVCLVCSLLVASAAVGLKDIQAKNAELDRKKNILLAAGFSKDDYAKQGVEDFFAARITAQIIELATGNETTDKIVEVDEKITSHDEAINNYDQIKTAKKKVANLSQKPEDDIAKLKSVELFSHVYLLKNDSGDVDKYIFPVRGQGLWSTMKGFLAVENDFQTIAGLTFYEHGETPGLGGEIDNVNWKKKWIGQHIYGNSSDGGTQVAIQVVKGAATPGDKFAIDGLAGATITSRGVSDMMNYWMGPKGFGPYIEKQKTGSTKTADLNESGEN